MITMTFTQGNPLRTISKKVESFETIPTLIRSIWDDLPGHPLGYISIDKRITELLSNNIMTIRYPEFYDGRQRKFKGENSWVKEGKVQFLVS